MSDAPDHQGKRLPRQLGAFSAVAVLVGTTIGSGYFVPRRRSPLTSTDYGPMRWRGSSAEGQHWRLPACSYCATRNPVARRTDRTWDYPLTPLLFVAASVFLLGNYAIRETGTVLINVGVVLSDVPVYLVWQRRIRAQQVC